MNAIQSILKRYGISAPPHNINLYKRAFIHKSYTKHPILENEEAGITIAEQPLIVYLLKQNLMND